MKGKERAKGEARAVQLRQAHGREKRAGGLEFGESVKRKHFNRPLRVGKESRNNKLGV